MTREPSKAIAWQPARSPLITDSATQDARAIATTASAAVPPSDRISSTDGGSGRMACGDSRPHKTTLTAADRPGGAPESWPSRNVISRSGQKTANTRAKIALPSTGPNTRLSIAAERLSPRRKYCSFGTVHRPERLRLDVVELHVVDEHRSVAALDHVAGPGGDAQHEHAVVRVAVGDDHALVALQQRARATTSSGTRVAEPVRQALREHVSVARRDRVGHRLRVVRLDGDEELGEVEDDESTRGDDTAMASARMIQRSMAATLPRAAVAAPACFFLHAGRGLRSRQLGGDA